MFEWDGARLAAEEWGEGPPVTVFLHAGVCDRRGFEPMIGLLGSDGSKLAYDRRGFGETPAFAGEFSHLEDLRRVVTSVADVPVWLVASSMGGGVALDLAYSSPELVAGLVLFAPAVSGAPEDVELDAATRGLFESLGPAHERGDLDEMNRIEAHIWLDGPTAPEGRVSGAARDLFFEMNGVVLANGGEDVGESGLDTWAHIEEITTPATVVVGGLDVSVVGELGERLAGRLPRGRLVKLAGRAHLPYLEDPGRAAELVRQAMAGDSAGPR